MSRRPESGFAMLLVFAMAAAVALMLYRELPRLVFESQRIKEQDLVARGLEYRRAIQLYVRKNRRYPQSLDDLERGTGVRYLRRRYKDPMTGKDEWRLIHIDNAGFFTDSLIHKPDKKEQEKKSENTFITEGAAFGSAGPAPGQEGHAAGAGVRGASDRPVVTAQQFQAPPGAPPPPFAGGEASEGAQQPEQTNPEPAPEGGQASAESPPPPNPYPYQPGLPFGAPPQPPGQTPPVPGQPPAPQPNPQLQLGLAPYVVPAQPNPVQLPPGGQVPYGVAPGQYPPAPGMPQPAYPFQQQPGTAPVPFGVTPYVVPAQPQPYVPQAVPGQRPAPYPAQGIPGLPGPYGVPAQPAPQPGPTQPQGAAGQANPALKMIQDLLTTPRPGGLQGLAPAAGGVMIPGGIAGVATTLEAEAIMVFNERSKYNEWEFLYDYRQDQAAAAASAALGAGVGSERNPLGAPQPALGAPQPGAPSGGASLPGPRTRFGSAR
jgi:hypothetical protein